MKILKQTKSAKVVKYKEGGIEFVEKTYYPAYSHYWDSESKHLDLMKGFVNQPELVSKNKKKLSLKFVFAGYSLISIMMNTNDTCINKLVKIMHDEIKYMSKVDGDITKINYKERFYYLGKIMNENVIENNIKNDISTILKNVDERKILMRYDPELDNYIINKEGEVFASDFAIMRYMHPLYVPAFFLIHLNKYENYKKLPIIRLLARQLFEKVNMNKEIFVKKEDCFKDTLKLCFLEVYSYLLNAYIEDKNRIASEKKNIDPTGQMEVWVRSSINKVLQEDKYV